jgi:hypothetical protein
VARCRWSNGKRTGTVGARHLLAVPSFPPLGAGDGTGATVIGAIGGNAAMRPTGLVGGGSG